MRLLLNVANLLPLLLLAACAGSPQKTAEPDTPPEPLRLPFSEPEAPIAELDSDVVFSALAGEIATQRGQLDLAYRYQLQTAILAGDAHAAERATRIAMLAKQREQALKAANLWIDRAPNDLAGRQLAASLLLQARQPVQALEQLRAVVAISQAKGDDGFLNAMAAVSKEQDHELALQVMRSLESSHHDDPRAGYALAMLGLIWKDYSLAETEIQKVVQRHPGWGKGYVLLSRLHAARGDKAGARRVLEQAVDRLPEDQLLVTAYARLLVDAGEYAASYRQFLKLERLQPGSADVYYSLGVLAMQLERSGDARRHFRQLQTTGQRSNEVAYYLGRIEQQDEHWAEALRWFKKVADGEFHDDARIRVAQILAQTGRLNEAQQWLQSLRIQMPEQSVQLFILEADILAAHAGAEQVMAVYAKALSLHPDDENLLYARALYAASIDRLDILETDLRRVIDLNPENADALNALGYTLADKTERYQEALDLVSRAMALKPDSAAILDSMGWIQFRLGHYQQALDYLQRALDTMPDSEIAAHLGEVLWVMGDKDRARAVWQQMLERDPDSSHVRETQGRLDR